jgi:cytochrome P450
MTTANVTAGMAGPSSAQPAPQSVFDPRDLESRGPVAAAASWVLGPGPGEWLFAFLRRFWPIPRIGNWAFVTRFDDVQEVLRMDHVFGVPFGDNVVTLNGGPNFLLGMPDGPDYQLVRKQVLSVFRRDDIDAIVTPMAARIAGKLVAASNGRIDAVQDLLTLVPTMICEEYYGVPVPDKLAFANWTIAMSTFMFGNPSDNPAYRRIALAGADRVRPVVDAAIARAKAGEGDPNTVTARLVRLQADGAPGLSDVVIRSYLIGMITGFVPTNTMAAGHMLEMLLRRPDFMAPTLAAARAGDDERLKRCLFEAMRFWPLNPGPFRICLADYTIAAGKGHGRTIKAGTKMVAGTRSAMFDERKLDNPRQFDPTRPPSHYMLFGYGLHWCVGAYIAEAQITQTFKALLLKNNLRRASGDAGKLSTFGPFPAHLTVDFDP